MDLRRLRDCRYTRKRERVSKQTVNENMKIRKKIHLPLLQDSRCCFSKRIVRHRVDNVWLTALIRKSNTPIVSHCCSCKFWSKRVQHVSRITVIEANASIQKASHQSLSSRSEKESVSDFGLAADGCPRGFRRIQIHALRSSVTTERRRYCEEWNQSLGEDHTDCNNVYRSFVNVIQ